MRIAGVALAWLVASALPAHAGGTGDRSKLVFEDPAGDANFVNDGGEHTTGNFPTATSEPSLDLRRVEVAPISVLGKRTGFTVTITTLGDLRDRTLLSFKARTKNCPDILMQYVHGAGAPVAQMRSGCSPDRRPLRVQVEARRVTLVVPFSALPQRARQDDLLMRGHVSSQVHVATEPVSERRIGTTLADTTLQSVRYRMR